MTRKPGLAPLGLAPLGLAPLGLATLGLALLLGVAAPVSFGVRVVAPASAAEAPQAVRGSATLRNFTLQNDTDQAIIEAHAGTKNGRTIDITTHGPIGGRYGQNFMLESDDCLSSMHVKFKDGHTMSRDNLDDCRHPRIVAGAKGIEVETSAGGTLVQPGKEH